VPRPPDGRQRPRRPGQGRDVGSGSGFAARRQGYDPTMLYTIFLILGIIALLMFIFGYRRV
jgi:hypothetical protein